MWSIGTLVFDGMLVYGVFSGLQALTFPSTQGTITVSNIESKTDSDGDNSFVAVVEYDYQVDGKKLHGDRLHAMNMGGLHSSAREAIRRFPQGKQVSVYYHPAHPEQAVLERGIQPEHLFMAMFMMPFNLVLLGSIAFAYRWLKPATPDHLPYGAFLRDRGLESELRIYGLTPLMATGIVLLAGTFAGIFVVALSGKWLPFSVLVYGQWILTLLAAVAFFYRQLGRATVLRLDRYQESLAIFRRGNPLAEVTIPQSQLHDVRLNEKVTIDSEGDESVQVTPHLIFRDANGELQNVILAEGWTRDPAERLARWLKANFFKPPRDS